MNVQNQVTQHSLNCKLKPISFIVITLFSQHVYAGSEPMQDRLTLLPAEQPAERSVIESKPLDQTSKNKFVNILVADASTAVKSQQQINAITNRPNVDDVTSGGEPKPNRLNNNLPTTAERYGATKEILKTAAASDGQAQGTGKTDSQGKPIGNAPVDINLKAVTVRAKRFHEIGPLPGLGLTKEEIPGNVQSISAKEIKEAHSLSLTDLLNKKLQSVNVNDYQGNPFQMDVTYRGFTAGPQIGTPQGLSVFFDGIRVNEPFGDVVNWDMIPMNAIAGVDVFPGSNPIFGLNTLGGAFTLKTKDGFTNEGVDAEILTGSYGRKQLQVEGGINNGKFALFGAGNFFLEDGWRQNSPSKVNQFFGKASYRGDKLDLNLSTLLVGTDLVGNGLLPTNMYDQNHSSVFTAPDTTKNNLQQFQLSGAFQVDDSFSITGQAYRRNSKRHQKGSDVYTYDEDTNARRLLASGEQYTCLFASTNAYGIPDYAVITVDPTVAFSISDSAFMQDLISKGFTNADFTIPGVEVNKVLGGDPVQDAFKAAFIEQYEVNRNLNEQYIFNRNNRFTQAPVQGEPTAYSSSEPSYNIGSLWSQLVPYSLVPGASLTGLSDGQTYYYTNDGGVIRKNYVVVKAPINNDQCGPTQYNVAVPNESGHLTYYVDPATQTFSKTVDGFISGDTGVVDGTPTALFTDNNINQITDGFSMQLNWNLEHHKFMVGASIDASDSDYTNSQQLGFLDANRNAYLAPDQAHPQFAGADVPVVNNNFSGTQTTKSLYFSETWSPVETLHINASGRYNDTHGENKIATRYGIGVFGIGDFTAFPDTSNTCTDKDGNGIVDAADCVGINTGYKTPDVTKPVDAAETEKFSYYSFNPSLGVTWQAKENLNVFANWSKGTRVPSVIELGCAFDDTPTPNLGGVTGPKSIVENRQCTLPSTLSGDPFLEQIKATTYDIGMRGTLKGVLGTDGLEWNLGAYQTDLKDDIYFVAVGNGAGFFDNIGKTRRRGLEAGLSGRKDKWGFAINYGLTDATFQDNFIMISDDNSSAYRLEGYGDVINVKKGSRMPGVPLHNLNANVSYEITPKWQVGLTAVVHSKSYVRGNENNEHQQGVVRYITYSDPVLGSVTAARQPTTNPGTVPGYATFNLQTSYKFNSEWTGTIQINNLFDKEYFSAGRLGRNPFSPSINGAIGPDGYNHNSGDWLSTNFISPSAPRGIWVSLNWQFDAKK